MSTGLECSFFCVSDKGWYYLLQDGNCPVQCWDWRDYATGYGPFTSMKEAEEHLDRYHANPGGYSFDEQPRSFGALSQPEKERVNEATR